MPIPKPPVGGKPYSSAWQNVLQMAVSYKFEQCGGRTILINSLGFQVSLLLVFGLLNKTCPLIEGVVQLGVRVADLLSAHECLKAFGKAWNSAIGLGKGRHAENRQHHTEQQILCNNLHLGMAFDESWVDTLRLDVLYRNSNW